MVKEEAAAEEEEEEDEDGNDNDDDIGSFSGDCSDGSEESGVPVCTTLAFVREVIGVTGKSGVSFDRTCSAAVVSIASTLWLHHSNGFPLFAPLMPLGNNWAIASPNVCALM